MPKGKEEPGETMENAALREVKEECGLTGLRVKHHICNTYHCYKRKRAKKS
ncbi:MAG: NUDIX hydrolase [Bacteroidales bacterium]|nr:NUDIX hydrolase [Bacteroidales bacterium]